MHSRKRYLWEGLWHFIKGWEGLLSRFVLSITVRRFDSGSGPWWSLLWGPGPFPHWACSGCWLLSLSSKVLLFDRLSVEPHPPQRALSDSAFGPLSIFWARSLSVHLEYQLREAGWTGALVSIRLWLRDFALQVITELSSGRKTHCPRVALLTSVSFFFFLKFLYCFYSVWICTQLDGIVCF